MSHHARPIHEVLGRMSDEEGEDDVPEDLEIAFVPKAERVRQHQSTAGGGAPHTNTLHSSTRGTHAGTSASLYSPSTSSVTTTNSAGAGVVARAETVYEQERNAKVRALLAEQQKKQHPSRPGIFSLDLFDSAVDALQSSAPPSDPLHSMTAAAQQQQQRSYYHGGQRGGFHARQDGSDGRGRGRDKAYSIYDPTTKELEAQRRYRMPNANMSEEEQARFIRSRRNIAVTRNALREVDPETLEYTQVTQAADQVPVVRAAFRGRGGPPSQGRGFGYRGRGGGRGYGHGGQSGGYRGGGGGTPFSPY